MPEVHDFSRSPNPHISVMLDDWSVRDSFHLTHYLNHQTLPRQLFEIIWVEYYDRTPRELLKRWRRHEFEQWIRLEREGEFHHGVCQNAGLAASRGRVIVVPDSDSVVGPTFMESVFNYFFFRWKGHIHRVLEHEQVVLLFHQRRIRDRSFFPFNYPRLKVLRAKAKQETYKPNYGACLAVWKDHLVNVGGFNEDPVMSGIACPWTEMVARLKNYGLEEVWCKGEDMYHTWHPKTETTTSRKSRAWIRKVKAEGIVQVQRGEESQ